MAAAGEPPALCEVVLQNPCDYPDLAPAELETWLHRLVGELAPEASTVVIRFLDDPEMRELNARFRRIDRPTDVLSFPGERTAEGYHLGDVAIAVPTARRQAEERDHSLERELKCLLLHGVLHCLGHDHENDSGEMNRLELELRERWIDDAESST